MCIRDSLSLCVCACLSLYAGVRIVFSSLFRMRYARVHALCARVCVSLSLCGLRVVFSVAHEVACVFVCGTRLAVGVCTFLCVCAEWFPFVGMHRVLPCQCPFLSVVCVHTCGKTLCELVCMRARMYHIYQSIYLCTRRCMFACVHV